METKSLFDRIITLVLLVLCMVLAAVIVVRFTMPDSSVAGNMPPASAQTKKQNQINVSTIPVERGTFARTTTLGAELTGSMNEVQVSTTVAGKVVTLPLSAGDPIQIGDVIAVIDPSTAGSTYKSTTITSALAGTVSQVQTYVGERVSQGQALISIEGGGELLIKAQISERFLSSLKVGLTATFTTSAWPDEPFEATLTAISASVNPINRTVEVTLKPNQVDPRLKEGMFVSLRLVTELQEQVVAIPTEAITTYLGESVVYVVEDGVARRKAIVTGSSDDSRSVILEGLEGGELLITAGSVTEGSLINVIKESV